VFRSPVRAIADSRSTCGPAGAVASGDPEILRPLAALEFAANIGKWQLKGIDLIKFNDAGEMIEFEVMIRPIKALQALGEEMGSRIGPQLSRLKELAGIPR
jgi:hypothetical protein